MVVVFYNILFIWGIIESSYGILQVFRLANSHNEKFILTGHFDNPGPFGGFIACIVAVAIMYIIHNQKKVSSAFERITINLSYLSLSLGLVILPASFSRSAWIGLIVTLVVLSLRLPKVRMWIDTNKIETVYCVIVLSFLICGLFLFKKDSALGRMHMWHMELNALVRAPLNGYGKGYEMGAYGESQALYFRTHLENNSVSERIIKVAGCPEYPFNEYLGVGLAYGIPVMFAVVAITIMLITNLWLRGSPMAAGITTLSIFAAGSYPMNLWQFWVLLALFVTGCGRVKYKQHVSGTFVDTIISSLFALLVLSVGMKYMKQTTHLKTNGFRSIYYEAYGYHLEGNWRKSNELLEIGAKMSSDPMFHVIMGKNYEAMDAYDEAEKEYWIAHYMVPCRIYPLARLMHLKIHMGKDEEAIKISKVIEGMPVNNRSENMIKLKNDCLHIRDSLCMTLADR